MSMKIALVLSEDVIDWAHVIDGPENPGANTSAVFGRFVACASFLKAIESYGSFEYFFCPLGVPNRRVWDRLRQVYTIPLISALELPTLLAKERVILHELSRHRLTRLANLRSLYGSTILPITSQIHGMGWAGVLEELCLMLVSPLLPCDTVICASRSVQIAFENALALASRTLERLGASVTLPRTEYIPLGVDTDFFRPIEKLAARMKLNLSPDEFVFLFLGRLSPLDRVDLSGLIKVFAEIVKRFGHESQLRLVIAGSDPTGRYSRAIMSLAREFGVSSFVTCLEKISGSERPYIYSAADVFLGLSDTVNESFGLTIVEALACGVPVIAADWNGYKETVEHGYNGFKVPVIWSSRIRDLEAHQLLMSNSTSMFALSQSVAIDLAALSARMVDIIQSGRNGKLARMSKNAVASSRKYSWQSVIPRYEALWENLGKVEHGLSDRRALITPRSEIFSHYASIELQRTDEVELTVFGEAILENESQRLHIFGDLTSIGFSNSIVERVLETVSNGRKRIVDVLGLFPKQSESTVIWHFLWLMKHGYLQLSRKNK